MRKKKLPSIHPGEVLLEEFLKPMKISQYRISHDIKVPPRRINEIVKGVRRITADTALRLSKYFGTTAEFWINMQGRYDLEIQEDKIYSEIKKIENIQDLQLV